MDTGTIERSQHTAAKAVGSLYLFTIATSIFAESYVRGKLIVWGDAAQTAKNITASESLFRFGVVSDLIMVAGVVPLVWGLYVILSPVNRNVALLAAFWRLVGSSVYAASALYAYAALALMRTSGTSPAIDPQQGYALGLTFLGAQGTGVYIAFVFLGLGSTTFSCLWFKSRYIPRSLAALGVFGSLVLAVVTLVIMVFPNLEKVVTMAYMAPLGIYEVTLGFWLLTKGIRDPQ